MPRNQRLAGGVRNAADESELVSVMAHEPAHVAARHGPRLMKRAGIANIIYQAAQVAAITSPEVWPGLEPTTPFSMGFFGLGIALELTLLGVNREFEADQLRSPARLNRFSPGEESALEPPYSETFPGV